MPCDTRLSLVRKTIKTDVMNFRYFTMIGSLSALAAGGALLATTRASASEQGVEELTRGPLHEAFAATVTLDPEPGMFVRTSPPALIEEAPPDQRPEGDNITWIPGYWGWDEEQNDFIWISGVWRNLPPSRQWVPGYWAEAGDQWQWTSGYWADEQTEEVTYVPKPPRSIEAGQSVEAPSRNHMWVSGTWINRNDRYAWRPGYWEPGQTNWIWIPAHYQWTPRGYIFIEGYWDYNVAQRGVVFAPVHFHRDYYNRPNYIYTPLVVIALNVFADHLFVRPRYGHYYFGDYYAPRYHNEGFYASFSYRSGRSGYDPIYAHRRWEHRDDRDWERTRRDNFAFYQSNEDARPPRTWATLQSRPEGGRKGQRDNYQFAEPLQQYASNSKEQKFETVSVDNRTRIVEQNKQVRKFSHERKQMENRPDDKATEGPDKRIQVKREKFQKSPVVAKPAEQLSGKNAPPKRPIAKETEPRNAKTTGPDDKGDKKNADEPKKGGKAKKDDTEDNTKPDTDKGKGKGADQGREKNEVRPGSKAEPDQRQKGEPNINEKDQDTTRPEWKATEEKGSKSHSTSKREDSEPNASKKHTKSQEPERKAQAEPKPQRTAEPEKKQQKAQPEPPRQAEPQRQRQPRLERTVQPEKKQSEPTRQAEPQRQVKPYKEPSAPKKKSDKEEDLEETKKKR